MRKIKHSKLLWVIFVLTIALSGCGNIDNSITNEEIANTDYSSTPDEENELISVFRVLDDMKVSVNDSGIHIVQKAVVSGREYSLDINLDKWEGNLKALLMIMKQLKMKLLQLM